MRQVNWRHTDKVLTPVDDGENWRSHIQYACGLGLPVFQMAPFVHDGTMVVVGSGPSMPGHVEEIREEVLKGRSICAIKGAHDFLCEHGIEPDLFVSVEPRDRSYQVQYANDETVYYLSSQCHPNVFDALKYKKIIIFHTAPHKAKILGKDALLIPGGTTSGLRAVALAWYMGFSNFVLYGFDSCLAEDGKTKRFTGEQAGPVVDRIVGNRRFFCNMAMAMQADEFQEYYKTMPGVHFDIKGEGLLAAIVDARLKEGYAA